MKPLYERRLEPDGGKGVKGASWTYAAKPIPRQSTTTFSLPHRAHEHHTTYEFFEASSDIDPFGLDRATRMSTNIAERDVSNTPPCLLPCRPADHRIASKMAFPSSILPPSCDNFSY